MLASGVSMTDVTVHDGFVMLSSRYEPNLRYFMSRIIIILSGGTLAMLVAAGASTIAYKITKPEVAQQRAIPAELVDATLTKHLRESWEEMALP
jgi:hypothetical protein